MKNCDVSLSEAHYVPSLACVLYFWEDRQGNRFLKWQQLLKLHICIAMDRSMSQKATRLKGEVAFEHTWYRYIKMTCPFCLSLFSFLPVVSFFFTGVRPMFSLTDLLWFLPHSSLQAFPLIYTLHVYSPSKSLTRSASQNTQAAIAAEPCVPRVTAAWKKSLLPTGQPK